MTTRDDTGLVSDEVLRHGPRRPWLGPHRPNIHRWVKPVIEILHVEAAGGVALFIATVAALVWANSPWQNAYDSLWTTEAALRVGGFELREDLRHWVNDGLMALFFFVVGLEIKTELVQGELADRRRAALPVAAAAGGMVVPAALYAAVNLSGGAVLQGWGGVDGLRRGRPLPGHPQGRARRAPRGRRVLMPTQIEHGTDRRARHLAQVLQMARRDSQQP